MDPHYIPVPPVYPLFQDTDMFDPLDSPAVLRLSRPLVGRILLLASQTDGLSTSDHSSWIARRTALFTSQVSREWRAAALEQPAIWLGPVFSWHSAPQWLEIILKRSSPVPLDAIIPPGVPSVTILLALSHLSRIRRLEFEIKSQDTWHGIEKQLGYYKAPLLESLSVQVPLGIGKRCLFQVYLDNKILGGCAPLLRKLRTNNCAVDLNNPFFHKLKVLEISNMQYVPVSHVLDTLQEMTDLEELAITRPADNVSFSNFHVPLTPSKRVAMQGLRKLSIAAPTSACADILRHLDLSKSCSLALSCRNYSASNIRDLGAILLAHLKKVFRNGWARNGTVQQFVHTGASRILFAVQAQLDDDQQAPPPPLSLEISWINRNWTDCQTVFEKLFSEIAQTFGKCETPETLTLSSDADLCNFSSDIKRFLAEWLASLGPTVYKVEFRNNDAFTLYGPLLHSLPADYEMGDFVLERMTDIALNAVNFSAQRRAQWFLLTKILEDRSDAESVVMDLQVINYTGEFNARYLAREYGVDVTENDAPLSGDDSEGDDSDDADFTVQEQDSDYQMSMS